MYFNRALSLLLVLAFSGCSLRLNEEMKPSNVSVNPLQAGCLTKAGDVTERFLNASISDEELNSFWNCLDKAVVSFSQNTSGASGDHFKGAELAGFLSKYFLKGKVIEPAYVREAMTLKQALIGGSNEHLTREELVKIQSLFKTVRGVTLKLRSHMPLRVESYIERKYTAEQFEESIAEFQSGMMEISNALKNTQGSYPFDSLASFLGETKNFLYPGVEAKNTWVDSAIKLTRALRPAKSIFVAPPRDEIQTADWARIYELAPQYYSLYLRSQFYLRSKSKLTHGAGLVSLERLFSDMVQLMEMAVKNQPAGSIESSEIEEFIDSLQEAGLLSVKPEAAKSAMRFVFARLITGQNSQEYKINAASLSRLRDAFLFGSEGLRAIEAAFRDKHGSEFENKSLSPEQMASVPSKTMLAGTAWKNEISLAAVHAVKYSAAKIKTVFPKEEISVVIPEDRSTPTLSITHLAKVHSLYALSRFMFEAYAGHKAEALSEAQVMQAANELFPILEEFGLVSAETKSSVPARLSEASLFLYSSDGDTGINFPEALEFGSLLASTVHHGTVIHEKIAMACGFTPRDQYRKEMAAKEAKEGKKLAKDPSRDDREHALIPAQCYREKFLAQIDENWAYIPGLARFFKTKREKEQLALFTQMETFLRKNRNESEFKLGDSFSFVLLPYYVELLFSRFDEDKNGILDNVEADKAYPVFRPFLAKKAEAHGLTSAEDHAAIFSFLLAYQTLPTEMKSTWIWRRYITGSKKFRIDRSHVIQIFQKLLSP